ncbi:MAG: FimB/Mfa2 family fimbrial subunit [Tannerellaceae bacterium]|nr:FimB/Mfa2 family fimbrial subunit [Tannerellaceae bacterium]
MKTKTVLILKTGFLLALLLTFTACMKEDLDQCGTTRVWITLNPEMYELPAGEHQIENIHVYMFNESETLVAEWQGGPYDYRAGQPCEVPVDLPPGIYHFIAWTNTGQQYQTNKATRLKESELHLRNDGTALFKQDIPDLHYAAGGNIIVDPRQDHEYTLYLIPNTYRINLEVNGLPGNNGNSYPFTLSDNNSAYDFNNRIADNQPAYTHERTGTLQQGKLNATIRTLTLHNDHAIENIGKEDTGDRSPILTLREGTGSTTLFTGNLVKIIRTAYAKAGKQADFDKTYQFDIILSFDADMNVTISVNGWTYTPNGTEL